MANEFKIKKGLIVTGADGGTVVDIQGSQGQLFSVTDDLSGSIFAVSDISGVPILDVNSSGLSTFSDNVVIGSVDSVVTGLNIGEASPTIQLFDTTNDGKLLMYMQDSSAVIGTYSNHALQLFSDSTLALTIDISQNATFAGTINAATFLGDLNGTINTATTGVTQTAGNNSTLIATTAFVTAAVAAAPQGDITAVTAGTGLTGGGTSGDVTLNVIGGNGITANANDVIMSGEYTGALRVTEAVLSGTTYSDPDLVLTITDQDTDISIRDKISGSNAITKVDDSTAPAPGCFQVTGSYYPQGFGPSYKISEGDEFTFEFWVKWESGAATSNLLYAGSNFYNAAGAYLGNSQRYWGESGLQVNPTTATDWVHVSGTLGPSRGGATGQIPTTAETMRLLFLFNYAPNDSVVTRYCGLKVYKSNPTITKLYRKTLGSEAGSTRNRDIVIDSNGDITANDLFVNGNVGIGTTSPSAKLHITKDNTTGNALLITNSGESRSLEINHNADGTGVSDEVVRIMNDGTRLFTIESDGNVGIGTTSPSSKLQVVGNVRGGSFGVQEDSVNPSNNTMTRVTSPAGATYDDQSNSASTGIISVILPVTGSNTMLSFTIRVFDYAQNESFDVHIAGYWYTGHNWTNMSTRIESESGVDRNFNIRFGRVTATNRGWVGIGETNTQWGYLKFSVINFQAAHVNDSFESWADDWDTAVLTSIADYTLATTRANSQVNNWKRNGANLYYGGSSGNVGIGTTSPEATLHIDSTDLGQTENDTTTQAIFSTRNSNAAKLYIQDYRTAAGNSWTSSGKRIQEKIDSTWMGYMQFNGDSNNGGISFGTGTNTTQGNVGERMRITSSGNVGIGATDPLRKLHVVGNFAVNAATDEHYGVNITGGQSANPNILIGDWHNSSANIKWDSTGNYLRIDAQHGTSGAPIVFSGNDSATEYMRIDSAGNVGIGATNPGKKLEVNGSFKLGTNAYIEYGGVYPYTITTANTAAVGNLVFSAGLGSAAYESRIDLQGTNTAGVAGITLSTAATARMVVTADGDVGIGTTTPNAKLDVQGTQGQLFSVTDDLSGDIFSVADISGVPIMNVNSSGLVTVDGTSYFNGNVGIGTNSPGAKLEIEGDATGDDTPQLIVASGGADNNAIIHFTDDAGGQVNAIGALEGNILTFASQNELVFKTGTSSILGNTDTRMTIYTNGNVGIPDGGVGIGVTNPSAKLQVYRDDSTLAASLAEATSRASVKIRSSSTDGAHLVISQGASGCTQLQVSSTNATTPRNIKIQPFGGNVGIGTGTANPSDRLVVVGNVVATNFVLSSDERKKTKIKDLTCNNIDVNWRSFELKQHEGEYRTGVIAQELEQSHPEFVKTDNEGFKSVKYIDLLIAKIAELEARLEKLEK